MEHLTSETLARLVGDPPADEERRHLDECTECAEELRELREQTAALRGLPDLRPPPGDWEILRARLVSEGLIERDRRFGGMLATTPAWMRAVAGLVLFLGGVGAGLAIRGPAVANFSGAVPEASTLSMDTDASSPEEAAEIVRIAERRYMDALVQYRQFNETGDESGSLDAAARFAAIEYLVRASQAAVREVPGDPFVNGFLASAMAERDAQLRRISSSDDQWY